MQLPPLRLIPNPTENPDVIEAMNLSITRIDEDVIEVPSMTSMGLNTWFKLIFFAIMLGSAPAYDPGWFSKDGEPGVAYKAIHKMLYRESYIISTFEFYEDSDNPGFLRDGTPYDQFKIEQLDFHGRGIVAGIVCISLIVLPWILLNLAVGNPYRIDRKRRIIYTWIRGSFVCIQLPEGTDDPLQVVEAHIPMRNDIRDPYNMNGPLNLWLPIPRYQKNGVLSLGANCAIVRSLVKYQAYYLRDFINDFIANQMRNGSIS
ncbi:hypothetical protein [Nitrincola nitratireducens]|uniref:Uncharacterized protein n=1 Tax=Nitrincola nitratireducens TaxID=1229521 RepID=W9UR58_9GAMM|nr:hypothetical protein [Nitrincola nitratireducens]EXJ09579.1 hypothetical protein D791_03421 [Nitrincola nitratireducens]